MMSEISHDEPIDAAFEIVQPGNDSTPTTQPSSHPPDVAAFVANQAASAPPAPSALPAFAQMPTTMTMSPANAMVPPAPSSFPQLMTSPAAPVHQQHVPPPPPAAPGGLAAGAPNPFSSRAAGAQSLSSAVHASPHMPVVPPSPGAATSGASSMAMPPQPFMPPQMSAPTGSYQLPVAPASTGLDMTSFEVTTGGSPGYANQPCDPYSPLSSTVGAGGQYDPSGGEGQAGVWNWINKTINNSDFLTKVAEKAKSSVDTMITTLDPQMKDFMNPAGALEFYVASDQVDMVSAVKHGFSRHFPNLIVRGIPPSYPSSVAVQPVSFEQGVTALNELMNAIRQSGLVGPTSLLFAYTSFLFETNAGNFYESFCVGLDNGAGMSLHTFSQPVAVPGFVMDIIKHQTPPEYPLASIGYAYSVEQVMSHSHGLSDTSWHLQYAGVSKYELISLACVTLANLYKSTCF